jgi:hypothetical protein
MADHRLDLAHAPFGPVGVTHEFTGRQQSISRSLWHGVLGILSVSTFP